MTLTFPTLAEQASTAKSLAKSLRYRKDVTVEKSWPNVTTYVFEDDTSLRVTGHGRAYKVEVLLP